MDEELAAANAALTGIEAQRREVEEDVDAAVHAHEAQVRATETRLESNDGYLRLKSAFEEARAVTSRAAQKQSTALRDRTEKGAPYENDPLFSYLWSRKFRTPAYTGGGLVRMLDGWVARVCRYDAAWLNYARLIELPDRLAEHVSRMKLEEAETESAIEACEAAALEADGVPALQAALEAARARLKAVDEELARAETRQGEVRARQARVATGEEGPQLEARKIIEEGLARASFPDLRLLAAETASLDDDRLVDQLVRLRTEELQIEVNWRNVQALPARRRKGVETVELVRRRFKQSGLDNPYVTIGRGGFEAAIEAYGRGAQPDADLLWRAITASVRDAPRRDDHYFGGRRRGSTIGLPDDIDDLEDVGKAVGGVLGVVLDEVIREASRGGMRRGGWRGGGGPGGWGGGWGGGSSSGGGARPPSIPRSGGGGRRGGGGFKTGGRF
jgi:hypothetical protein